MLNNLLQWFKVDIGEGAFYAVFGFLFVFCGIVLLILIFTALGKIMGAVNRKRALSHSRKQSKKNKDNEIKIPEPKAEGITPELIAVLSAAVAAYYEDENAECDFVVRRIRKI